MMTVRELIAVLVSLPPNLPVACLDENADCEAFEFDEVEVYNLPKKDEDGYYDAGADGQVNVACLVKKS